MMFCFKSILQIWIILIGFRDTNDFVNPGICKHEFKFTCRGYCRFTLNTECIRKKLEKSSGDIKFNLMTFEKEDRLQTFYSKRHTNSCLNE